MARDPTDLLSGGPAVVFGWSGAESEAVTFITRNVREVLGYRPEEFLDGGRTFADILHPDDRATVLRQLAEGGAQRSADCRVLTPDGETRWVRTLVRSLPPEAGEVPRRLAYVWDVSPDKDREAALRRAGAHYRKLFERSLVGMLTLDLVGVVTSANPAFCRLTGYTERQLIGRRLTDITVEDQVAKVASWLADVAAGRPDGWRGEHHYRHADGHGVWALDNLSRVDGEGGNADCLLLEVLDIDERKQWEDQMSRSLAVQNALGSVLRQSLQPLALEEVLATALDEILSVPWLRLWQKGCVFVHDDAAGILRMVASRNMDPGTCAACAEVPMGYCLCGRAAEQGELIHSLGHDARHEVWLPGTAHHGHYCIPIQSGDRLLGVLNTYVSGNRPRDPDQETFLQMAADTLAGIIQRKQAEQALTEKTEALERSNAELQQFAYVVSHDLQEPLRMVASYVQLLESRYRDRLDAAAAEYIAFASDGAKRMQAMIRDLLELSRVSTRQASFGPTDLDSVVEKARSNLTTAIEESGADLVVGPLPTVMADESQMIRLFQNLLGNAIKYREPDRPLRIRVAAERQDGQWRIVVADNGCGIPVGQRDRAFQVFQRLHGGDVAGTGMGLAICRKIVERHGGRLWVEDNPENEGSLFLFTLSAAAGPDA